MNTISQTAHEAIARRIVDRLCRRPPYGQAWRDFAIREISSSLAAEALRRTRERAAANYNSPGGVNAAAR
jgi:hypothetical protein